MTHARKRTIIVITAVLSALLIAVIIFALHYYITRAPLYEQDAYLLRYEYTGAGFDAWYILKEPADTEEALIAQIRAFMDDNNIVYKLRRETELTKDTNAFSFWYTLYALLARDEKPFEHPRQNDTAHLPIRIGFIGPNKEIGYGEYLENSYKFISNTGFWEYDPLYDNCLIHVTSSNAEELTFAACEYYVG